MNRQAVQLAEFAYPTVAKDAVLASPNSNRQLVVHALSAYNAHSAAMDVGLGVRFAPAAWKLYAVTASVTDVTSTIQAGSTQTILPTTNNHGFIVQAKSQFGLLSLTISQAETGSPTYSYQYWNGSAWTTLTLRNSPVYTSTGSIAIAFAPPLDWVAGNGSDSPDLSSTEAGYCIRVRGTTAPSQAVRITALHVSRFLSFRSLSSKATLSFKFEPYAALLEIGESVQAYFGTATANNSVEVSYQVGG